ncbi:hypothetical protein GAY28_19700 [Azospirillum brasilense]|nr:hypothetical protein [Azospirillum brasilense]
MLTVCMNLYVVASMSLVADRARLPVVFNGERIGTAAHPRDAAVSAVRCANKDDPSGDHYYQYFKVEVTKGAYIVTRRPHGERNPNVLAE